MCRGLIGEQSAQSHPGTRKNEQKQRQIGKETEARAAAAETACGSGCGPEAITGPINSVIADGTKKPALAEPGHDERG